MFECLITVLKHYEAVNLEERSPERLIAFECIGSVMENALRVVETASQTKPKEKIADIVKTAWETAN